MKQRITPEQLAELRFKSNIKTINCPKCHGLLFVKLQDVEKGELKCCFCGVEMWVSVDLELKEEDAR